MDSLMNLLQAFLYAVLLICVITLGVSHFILGYIGFFGFCVALFLAYLVWTLILSSWKEYIQEKNR